MNEAVAQGQHDVEAVKSTIGAEYVDQAKDFASSAISTAQVYSHFGVRNFGFSRLILFLVVSPRQCRRTGKELERPQHCCITTVWCSVGPRDNEGIPGVRTRNHPAAYRECKKHSTGLPWD